MSAMTPTRYPLAVFATEYAEQSGDAPGEDSAFVIPAAEELAALDDAALAELAAAAAEHFDSLYGDGTGLSAADLEVLGALTTGIEALAREGDERAEAAAERDAQAAALAARVRPASTLSAETNEDGEEGDADADATDGEDEDDATDEETPSEDEGAAETLTASAPAPAASAVRVSLASIRSRAAVRRSASVVEESEGIRSVLTASGEGLGVPVGTGMDWDDAGRALDKRIAGFNEKAYLAASAHGTHIREQHGLLSIKREIPAELTVDASQGAAHVESVLARATDESRLPQGSLVASGGWCAPSETLYDLLGEIETRDGLLSIPEIGIKRGGIQFTKGPSFAELYAKGIGFSFTEEQDIAGEYAPGQNAGDPNVVGDKPCYRVECTEFEEYRLDVDGLCISSGILQQRGYPELLARTIRGALIAHDHRMNGKMIAQMVAGSTAISLPGAQAGALAPILTAIELQVEHYRYTHRAGRNTTLEAIFPFWVRGAIRSDLSRRLGVDLLSVTNARIDAWFAERGVNPQFVYNWQAVTGTASTFTAWPNEVKFMLYSAGTWLRGAADVITMDSMYESTLKQNDFIALFTEEGWFVAKRGHDSRVVSVPLSADGAAHIGVEIAHNGIAA